MDKSIKQPYQWETAHATIAKEWLRAGYDTVPLMVYHNINVYKSGIQTDQNYRGVIQLTGRSEQVIKLVLYGEAAEEVEQEVEVDGVMTTMKVKDVTPYDTFRKAMEGEHFELLESVLRESHEGDMKYYS
jgi:uracil DNA glycosylase